MIGEKPSKHVFGKSGEDIALSYLKKKKYRIVESNFRFKRGEIDIIAYDRDTLVFIEVKTRKSTTFGFPEEAVTAQKQQQIRRIAQGFMAKQHLQEPYCRFDVISISFDENGTYDIHHIKNAF